MDDSRNIFLTTENIKELGKLDKLCDCLKQKICSIILKAGAIRLVLAVRIGSYTKFDLCGAVALHDLSVLYLRLGIKTMNIGNIKTAT